MKILGKRRWIEPESPFTMDFVVGMNDGRIGEAESPFYLCDLLFDEHLTDVDAPELYFILMHEKIRSIVKNRELNNERVRVYDAKGMVYDSYLYSSHKEELEPFSNQDDPVIYDLFDLFTGITSLIKNHDILLYEKKPVFSELHKKVGCQTCIFNGNRDGKPFCLAWDYTNAQLDWEKPCFWVTNTQGDGTYKQVTAETITTDMSHKKRFKPLSERVDHRRGIER